MRSSRARLQLLALLLLGAFALLSLDGAPVGDAVAGYFTGRSEASVAAAAVAAPVPASPALAVQDRAIIACPHVAEGLRVLIHRIVVPAQRFTPTAADGVARQFLEGAAS